MRLRRSSPGSAGLTRRRFGRGFAYFDARGARIDDPDVLDRISALAIPPAWNQVWICADPQGHIQATGTDAAGRRQYVYHQQWSRRREAKKQQRILELAAALPGARRRSRAALRQQGLTRGRVLAGAFRMLDIESFRVGSDAYANENGTYGLATLQRRHVSIAGDLITFTYVAKGGKRRVESIRDATLARLVGELLDRADLARRLLAWCDDGRWHQVTSGDINDEVRELTHGDFTAKDFRTWNATVLMAQLLALAPDETSARARKLVVRDAYRQVAEYLGNTPTVARSSYVDARVVDLYLDGVTIPRAVVPRRRRDLPVHERVERAVLRLLS